MVSSKNSDHPKKQKKKKKGGNPREGPDAPAESTSPKETPPTDEVAARNLFREKSKTLTDFRRKPCREAGDSPRSEWSQSSFRRRINSFIQNSPLLRRSTYLKHAPSLRNDLDRLSDSLESLKIDEGRVLTREPSLTAIPEPRKKFSKKSRSRSCNEFNLGPAEGAKCDKCEDSESGGLAKGGSLWNLPPAGDKNPNAGGIMKRSISLHLSARPWTWISGSADESDAGHGRRCVRLREEEVPAEGRSVAWGAKVNTPVNKDTIKKQGKSRHSSPEREDSCKAAPETRHKPHDWTRKLVGSIRRKVSARKSNSTASDNQNEEPARPRAAPPCGPSDHPQERKVEAVKKAFTDLEELELSPRIDAPRRKASFSGTKHHPLLERKTSHKTLAHQCAIKDEGEDAEQGASASDACGIRRKHSFPSAGEAAPKCEGKAPKKRDAPLLAFIFKKQASFDVKKEAREQPAPPPPEKPRKIPDFSFSNPGSPGGSGREVAPASDPEAPRPDLEGLSDGAPSRHELGTPFDSGRVGATPKTVSRSCGQVEMISGDPAVRENFLRATMSIFLAVSPPSSKIQVRSRSLTHIDQIEQRRPDAIFFKGMNSERTAEQLAVPTNISKHRRQMLSRSEASSSECFSVGFEGLGGEEAADEFVQASKNTILRDALLDICKRKGIDLGSSNVFLDANKSPLPCLDIDTSWMGGKHIRIKVNDRATAARKDQKNSFGAPIPPKKTSAKGTKSGSRTHNVSTEDPSAAEPGPSGKAGKRWSGFFGTSRDTSKMETLIELLDSYSRSGVYEYGEDVYRLEPDWKTIVACAGNLEDRHSQQQEAIWELLRSEVDYIKMLRVVSHLFIACLANLQSNQLLLEIDNKRLFGNVEEIYSCNDLFWKKYLMPVVEASRKTGEPLNPELLKDGFMDFPSTFKCYETYCTQQSRCQHYCRERLQQDQDNEIFTAYLAWCETQKQCNRLKLLDILVKPMQRLTKYSLLLKAILKHTSNPAHKESLVNMIKSVDFFVNNVNSTLKQNQDLETMKQLMSKIESYDVIESKDDDLSNLIQKYSNLNLTYDIPGTSHKRSLLFESDVKYKDASTSSKIEVHAFLFTDFLLITKPVKRLAESRVKFKIIRQPFVIDRLVTQEIARDPPSLACVYLSIYKTACTAFMLTCGDNELVKNWSDAMKKAKSLYASLKSLHADQPAHPPNTLPISRQPSGFTNEDASIGDNMEENKFMTYSLGLWAGRSPRGSSYGSRISSLVHSHSGSMEMTENVSSISSVSASRGVSVENNSEMRGSSLSSDDGNANLAPSPRVELTTSPRIERRNTPPVPERRESPVLNRPESKSLYRKSNAKTENTLTIQVPHLGQSLPNLNIASSPGGASGPNPCPPSSLLLAPPKSHGGLLSPSQRGVSYPPPSPPRGSLKRGFAIAPRNPPLVKTGHISMELSRSISVAQPPGDVAEEKKSKTIGLQTNFEDAPAKSEGKAGDAKCGQCACNGRGGLLKSAGKKLVRSERRCHPAAAPEVPQRPCFSSGTAGGEAADPPPANKHLSVASVHSSSGFSSAGSSVEGLFTREEAAAEHKPLKFEEILHIINLEDGGEEPGKPQSQSDLELFDSKVSKWQKYGFHGPEGDAPADKDSADRKPPGASPFAGAAPESGARKRGESPKPGRPSRKLPTTVAKSIHSLTVSVIALQLENILRMTSRQPPGAGGEKKKRRGTM